MKKKALVVGLGISGKSAASLLLRKGWKVAAVDKKAGEIAFPEVEIYPDSGDFSLEGFDLAVVSPGVPPTHPIVQKAIGLGIEVIGEIELGFRFISNRCLGITGTNGKTTTVLLTTHILNSAGKKARAVGNVGASLTDYLLHEDPEEILIVELSSFQLETLQTAKLEAAAILNITPNHLDRHPSMDDYAKAKIGIQRCLKPNGKLFFSQQVAQDYASLLRPGEIFDADCNEVDSEVYVKGAPERKNIRAAFCFCRYFGVSEAEFWRGLESFQKPPHRIEWVADVNGVSYYNDSKSSNVDSVMHAVRLFQGPLVLILGGVHKGSSYLPWVDVFRGRVKQLVAYGQAAPIMEGELAPFFPFRRVDNLEEAVALARRVAEEKETVLLSPGCSSYDQFRNFEHRGEEFKRLVKMGEVR